MPQTATPDEELKARLDVEASTAERISALMELLSPDTLRVGLGKTPEAYKAWLDDEIAPRRDAARALDNLRCAVLTLIDGGKEPARVERWLTSRLSAQSAPAIDLVIPAPEAVLAATDAEAESRAVAIEILEDATAAAALPMGGEEESEGAEEVLAQRRRDRRSS